MMPLLHEDSPEARKAYKAFVNAIMAGVGPYCACLKAYALNVQIDADWLLENYAPVHHRTARLHRTNPQEAAYFRAANVSAWEQERKALALIAARKDMAARWSPEAHKAREMEEAEKRRVEQREAAITMRAHELMAQYHSDQLEQFKENERRRYDVANPPAAPIVVETVEVAQLPSKRRAAR